MVMIAAVSRENRSRREYNQCYGRVDVAGEVWAPVKL